jgi:hypothetical protein
MKKFIIFLFVLLTAGTSVFAQEAQAAPRNPLDGWKFSGLMYSTMGYDIDEKSWGNTDVVIDGASMSFSYYTRLGVDYDRQNYGFTFVMMGIAGYDTSAVMRSPMLSIHQAYGWMKFLDKKLEVKAGAVYDNTYNSGGRISTDGGEGAGAMVKYNPITGLSIGGGLYAPRLPSGSEVSRATTTKITGTVDTATGVVEGTPTTTVSISTNGVGPVEKALVSWGAAYEMSKVFKITYAGSWRDNSIARMTSGIHLLAVPNLTANFEVFATGITYELDKYFPYIAFDQTVSYRIGRELQFGIYAYQFLNNTNLVISKGNGGPFGLISYDTVTQQPAGAMTMDIHATNTYDIGLSFDPWVSYQIGMFVPRLGMTFEHYGNTNEIITSMAGNVVNTRKTETERFLISLKPQVSLRLGLASLDLSYTLSMIMDTVNGEKADTVYDNKLALMFAMVF